MPQWLNTRGNSPLSIAICDRCKRKRAWVDLGEDPNTPGLKVCKGVNECTDLYDPWRLPPRQVENVSLPWARPDVPLSVAPAIVTEYEGIIIDEDNIPLSP